MVLEKLLAEGKRRDFLVGVGKGYLEIPNQCYLINIDHMDPRTHREYQGRKVGRVCFVGTCCLALYLGLSL